MSAERGPVVVLGAGGHAKVVIGTLLAAGFRISGAYDDEPSKRGTSVLGVPVVGRLDALVGAGPSAAVIGIGDNRARAAVARRFPDLQWVAVADPQAVVHPSARLGAGTVVFAGAVIQPDAVLGAHVIVNTGATVDHDCVLGDFVHVGPGSHLSGGVRLGDGAFLGIGSAVIPNREVGAWTVVGAGAVVVRDLAGGVTAVGVPARPVLAG
jgi:sugar O-acyltransferase (sialic acid O-acetyltransferase NeuD family)